MEIYLLRHGETEYNKQHRFMGTLNLPVCEAALLKIIKPNFTPDIVYVSPLLRTQQTANALFSGAKQIIVEDFKEMNFGEFEGICHSDDVKNENYKKWLEGGCTAQIYGGESRQIFVKRSANAFDKIVLENIAQQTQRLFIVAHGGTQMAVLSQFATTQRPYENWCAKNVGGYILTIDEFAWQNEHKLNVNGEICYSK